MHLKKIVSGGQTGVDRAALDAAGACGLDVGGWCPKGRRAEDGIISPQYPLQETPSADYGQRTEWNVRDSDATLILCAGNPSGGTALTERVAGKLSRPVLRVAPKPQEVGRTVGWIRSNAIETLNIAGPRESESPGIYILARRFVSDLLEELD